MRSTQAERLGNWPGERTTDRGKSARDPQPNQGQEEERRHRHATTGRQRQRREEVRSRTREVYCGDDDGVWVKRMITRAVVKANLLDV